MRIALTGVGGFIGSHTAKALAEAGHQVIGLVRDPGRAGHVRDVLADFVVGRFQDLDTQQRLCAAADCVIHSACDWDALYADNETHASVNVLGSLRLLETARQANVGQFIFISSISVYGEFLPGVPDPRKLDETHPAWPDSTYGAAKAAVEAFVKDYQMQYGMNTVNLRPGIVYGIHQPIERSWYYPLVRAVVDGQPIDTHQTSRLVDVQDVAAAAVRCAGNAAVAGKSFNLVDCHLHDQHVAEMARQIAGSASDIVEYNRPPMDNPFDVTAARALGVNLDCGAEGVEEYMEDLIEAMK